MLKSFKYALMVSFCVISAACSTTEPSKTPAPSQAEDYYHPIHQIDESYPKIPAGIKGSTAQSSKTVRVAKVPVMPELNAEKKASNPQNKMIKHESEKQAANILFANGSSAIDPVYNEQIQKIATQAKANNAKIRVCGFASSRTKDTDVASHKRINLEISMRRAENVAQALQKAGVAKDNIMIEALSDAYPLFNEAMPMGERLNRRVEIYVAR